MTTTQRAAHGHTCIHQDVPGGLPCGFRADVDVLDAGIVRTYCAKHIGQHLYSRETLLPLENGRKVIAADTWINRDGIGEGVVLAIPHDNEWVTWHVFRHVDQTKWVAEHGDYHHDLEKAREAYDERRAEIKRTVSR